MRQAGSQRTGSVETVSEWRPAGLFPVVVALSLLMALLPTVSSAQDTGVFDGLTKRLIEDGVPANSVYALFDDPRVEVIPRLLKINIKQPDASNAYERFKTDAVARQVHTYLDDNRLVFEEVLAHSPVNPEVVAAILKIESDFGSNQGPFPVMNVFATLALLESDQLEALAPQFWDRILEDLPETEHKAAIAKANKRKASKARWAYRELKTLIEMAAADQMDPLAVKGSWAGAYGMPQFLPSSFKAYSRDGNGDGHADLDTLHDAVASVANYLARHRYNPDVPAKRRKAVWHYNHSDDYVDAVLTLADKVALLDQP